MELHSEQIGQNLRTDTQVDPDQTGLPVRWPPLPRPPSWHIRPKSGVALELAFAFLLVALLIAGVAGLFMLELEWADRVVQGVRVWNVDLGGLSRDQAAERLATSIQYPTNRYPTLRYGNRSWPVDPAVLGVKLDVDATVDKALAVGHGGDLQQRFEERIGALRNGHEIEPVFYVEPGAGAMLLSRVAQEVNMPSRNAVLRLGDDLSVETVAAQTGRKVDETSTWQTLVQRLIEMEGGEVELVVNESEPLLTDLSVAQDEVQRILSGPITLVAPDFEPWIIEPETLVSWLTLKPEVDADGGATLKVSLDLGPVEPFVQEMASQIEREPRDARFRYDVANDRVIPVRESIIGRTLDVTETLSLIEEAIWSDQRSISLPLVMVPPATAMSDVPDVDSLALIGEGTSNFSGSSAARIQNIEVGSAQFDGVLVAPGQTFSFNHYLGEVNAEKGYAESIIIWGNETRTDVGGGLCQVSSTAFRAAFWAGVPITERSPHLYRVSYYEPPRGMDATIYSPYTDLKWVNDTDGYILIRTFLDKAKKNLTFRFYGTDVGRTVEMEGPQESRLRKPEPPVYRDSSTMFVGQRKQIQWAKDGMDVTVYRIIREKDGEVRRDEFFSRYEPWQAVYLVGTKPVPTPVPTPEPSPEPTPEPAAESTGG